jgi:hypothetical protein
MGLANPSISVPSSARRGLAVHIQSDPKESKMADKPIQGTQRPAGGQPPLDEHRGIVSEVLVPLAVTTMGGAAGPALAKGISKIVKKDK